MPTHQVVTELIRIKLTYLNLTQQLYRIRKRPYLMDTDRLCEAVTGRINIFEK